MAPDTRTWQLVVNHDFSTGNNTSLYQAFCGHQGSVNGPELNNFSPQNVYHNGQALVLKFEKRSNKSCTGVTRNYAGAGFYLKIPSYYDIAVEMEIKGTTVYGVSPYATTWPHNVKPRCGWGAEDDFFEQNGKNPASVWATYHYWDGSCNHKMNQYWYNISNASTAYHAYGVMRSGGQVRFYLDGVSKGVSSSYFQSYPMDVSMGMGAYSFEWPADSKLPAYTYVRRIKVWKKK